VPCVPVPTRFVLAAAMTGLQLLDRQVVDRDGRLAGKVDDLELVVPDEGGSPLVIATLSGRGALADRLGGRMGRAAGALSRRLIPEHGGPGRIWFGRVADVGNHVDIAADRSEVATDAVERAVRKALIARTPGSQSPAHVRGPALLRLVAGRPRPTEEVGWGAVLDVSPDRIVARFD
jgi:sporulation protein YlmC with PRC-barrel domain